MYVRLNEICSYYIPYRTEVFLIQKSHFQVYKALFHVIQHVSLIDFLMNKINLTKIELAVEKGRTIFTIAIPILQFLHDSLLT